MEDFKTSKMIMNINGEVWWGLGIFQEINTVMNLMLNPTFLSILILNRGSMKKCESRSQTKTQFF